MKSDINNIFNNVIMSYQYKSIHQQEKRRSEVAPPESAFKFILYFYIKLDRFKAATFCRKLHALSRVKKR